VTVHTCVVELLVWSWGPTNCKLQKNTVQAAQKHKSGRTNGQISDVGNVKNSKTVYKFKSIEKN